MQHEIIVNGVGTFLPGSPVSNNQLANFLALDEEWIDLCVGNKYRYFSYDLDKKNVIYSLTDLAEIAAKKALLQANMQATDIDFLVMSTATSDFLMPATVNLVADRLGMNDLATYELRSGCSGILQGLDLACNTLQANTHYTTALVIGADTCNQYLQLDRAFNKLSASELVNYVLFGDGAGALVLSKQANTSGISIKHISNRFVGLGREAGQLLRWTVSSFDQPTNGNEKLPIMQEDYKAIEKYVPQMASMVLDALLTTVALEKEHIQYFLPPQLNGNMITKIAAELDISPEKSINCVVNTGNCGNALPLLQFEDVAKKMSKGEIALGIAIESSKWLQSGIVFEFI